MMIKLRSTLWSSVKPGIRVNIRILSAGDIKTIF